jgi:hypothetical protein
LYIQKSQNDIFGIYRFPAHPDMLLFQYLTAAILIAAFFCQLNQQISFRFRIPRRETGSDQG